MRNVQDIRGDLLGRYIIKEMLSQNYYGKTYNVLDLDNRKHSLAVKFINSKDQMLHEMKVMERLHAAQIEINEDRQLNGLNLLNLIPNTIETGVYNPKIYKSLRIKVNEHDELTRENGNQIDIGGKITYFLITQNFGRSICTFFNKVNKKQMNMISLYSLG